MNAGGAFRGALGSLVNCGGKGSSFYRESSKGHLISVPCSVKAIVLRAETGGANKGVVRAGGHRVPSNGGGELEV